MLHVLYWFLKWNETQPLQQTNFDIFLQMLMQLLYIWLPDDIKYKIEHFSDRKKIVIVVCAKVWICFQ